MEGQYSYIYLISNKQEFREINLDWYLTKKNCIIHLYMGINGQLYFTKEHCLVIYPNWYHSHSNDLTVQWDKFETHIFARKTSPSSWANEKWWNDFTLFSLLWKHHWETCRERWFEGVLIKSKLLMLVLVKTIIRAKELLLKGSCGLAN